MKVVILAGGYGTRLAEETEIKPKPMVEIGGRPIIWHIMKHYSHYGHNEFIIALGYKGEFIKHYFMNYSALCSNLEIDLNAGKFTMSGNTAENWNIHLVDTGLDTYTGGRLKRLKSWLQDDTFMLTYGDGVSNINIPKLLEFHYSYKKIATVSAVRPPARYGGIIFDGDIVTNFTEKPQIGEGWISGGYFVFEPAIFNHLENDRSSLEAHGLEKLAKERQLAAYRHEDFWQCMDTLRDKNLLESLWKKGNAPWKVW